MDELVNRFKNFDMNNDNRDDQNVVTQFLSTIENDYQYDIVLKLFCNYSGNLYLYEYSKDEGLVYILGSRTSKGRETYTVSIKPDHSLSCNCKDFQFRSKKLGIVCKHITFLVCKVGYILDPDYFTTKRLTDKQYTRIINVLDNNAIWKNKHFSVKDLNKDFQINDNDFDEGDSCPICYDSYGDINVNISCPQCKNYIHKKCMDIWLETNKNCVYCRSYSWKNYVSDLNKI